MKFLTVIFCSCLLTLVTLSSSLIAQDHVISTGHLHQVMMSEPAARQNNIRKVETFLSYPPIRDAVKKSGFNLKEVQQGVPSLDNQELARLEKTTDRIQNNFAAGGLTHKQLTLIVVAAVVVVIILALKA